ncbi:uncharacterized protein EDB91DRAFT_1291061 [Suillus paluster]|uniref:uncharacterized protein n=1 Tax=Suillus paluster TaxID=48578 RepID=UPI001B873562|nr:uncharacterized protein EDB91DRAFT_1291061 [Suillus paluster]KAG1737096.1 hypothetical protein EDB91DRAFT_1291061 [Suillus paluster]
MNEKVEEEETRHVLPLTLQVPSDLQLLPDCRLSPWFPEPCTFVPQFAHWSTTNIDLLDDLTTDAYPVYFYLHQLSHHFITSTAQMDDDCFPADLIRHQSSGLSRITVISLGFDTLLQADIHILVLDLDFNESHPLLLYAQTDDGSNPRESTRFWGIGCLGCDTLFQDDSHRYTGLCKPMQIFGDVLVVWVVCYSRAALINVCKSSGVLQVAWDRYQIVRERMKT